MSDKQKVIASLTLVSETCTAALSALSSPVQGQDHPGPPLPILHKDLSSLLSLLHSDTTKTALSLKPSGPAYAASLTPLKDLSTHTAALLHNAQLFNPSVHGATLVKEVHLLVKDVIDGILGLASALVALQADSGMGTGQAGEQYMVRTGAVHDQIERARKVSVDNWTAVKKKLIENRGALEDGYREVGEMIEDAEGDGEEDEEEDGWGELGLASSSQMTPDELERTKQVHSLLRLTTLMHRRIILDIFALPSPPIPLTSLDALPAHSTALLTASDDLAASLYTPQDSSNIQNELTATLDVVHTLQSSLGEYFVAGIAEQMQGMRLSGSKPDETAKAKKDPKKWFETCFDQIYKLSSAFASTLAKSS